MKVLLSIITLLLLSAGVRADPGREAGATRPTTAPTTSPTTIPTTNPTSARSDTSADVKGARLMSAVVIDVVGEINDYTALTFERQFEEAERLGARSVIIRLHTPGGGVGAALDMSRLIKVKSKTIHTVAYIDAFAYSAGTLLAVACQEIVMSDHSFLGDCAPIIMAAQGGLENLEGANRAKMESPLVAEFEDSAERNGYDPVLLRAFVQYQLKVYVVVDVDGQRRFVSQTEYDALDKSQWKLEPKIKNPLDDELTLLTMNEKTALAIGLSKGTFGSLEAFADTRGYDIEKHFSQTGGEALIGFLNGNAVRGILSTLFMITLYMAFSKPGTGVPELALVIVSVLLFGVPLLTGYASWLEIILIIIGVGLLAAELFIIPGFGVTGIAGIVLVMVGMTMTFVPSEAPGLPGGMPTILPQLQQTQTALKEGLLITAIGISASIFLWFWLARFLPSIPYMNRLVLTTNVGQTPDPGRDVVRDAVAATWPMVGSEGTAATDLCPGGVGRFGDPIINDERNTDVICDRGFVPAGTRIIVRERQGMQVVVREVAEV